MKLCANEWWVALAVVGLLGCKPKEKESLPDAPGVVVTPSQTAAPVGAPEPVVKVSAVSPEQRATKLGFAQHLPQDTEVVMAFHQGAKSVERIKSAKLWKFLAKQMGMNVEPDPSVATDVPESDSPAALFGTEFTIAMGKSTGEQSANVLNGYSRVGYFQMRLMAQALGAAAKSGEFATMGQAMSGADSKAWMKDWLADSESGIELLERLKMPPLYVAYRAPASQREGSAQQLAGLIANLGMLGNMVEAVEIEKAGCKFVGQKISGEKIAASMKPQREEMEKSLEPALVEKLLAAIAKKDLVVMSGTLGDYVVLFVGSSIEDLSIAPDAGHSLVACDALAFCDAYADKDLAAVMYGQKAATDRMISAAGGLSHLAAGLRDGLAGTQGLGDTRDLEALLRMVGERETALRKLAGNDALGLAAFFENGLKIESYGGCDSGAVDWQSPNKLSALGDGDGVVMFADMTADAVYDKKFQAYLEVLMETAFAVAMKVSEIKSDDASVVKFQQATKQFDTQFRTDAVAIWDALSGDFNAGIGLESACVIDLNGSVPTVPGIPQAVVDHGKFPRLSFVAPVTDRAKLAASWEKMNASATQVVAKISTMIGKEIPMPKPMSSEKDGYMSSFFPLPFFNDDFMPSVTVGDKWFAASTSKNQALDLITKAANGSATRPGFSFALNFKALQKFSRETLEVLDKAPMGATGVEFVSVKNREKIRQFADALDGMDALTVDGRREGGALRWSIHLKTR